MVLSGSFIIGGTLLQESAPKWAMMRLQALKKVPDVNAAWYPDFTRRFHNIDISIAVQTPVGLMVPILRNADGRGLTDISSGIKVLVLPLIQPP